VIVALAGCLASVGCGSSSPHKTKLALSYPTTVSARPLGPRQGVVNVRRGALVPLQDLGERVFPTVRQGFALANISSELYPAATTDGGKTWRTDGPVLYLEAAQAPSAVDQVGTVYPSEYFAFGSSAVDLTTDGGRHWWQAFLGDDVLGVVPGTKPHHLIAVVQDFLGSSTARVATLVYVSNDGGRHWHSSDRFAY
jgi:hypothetical protein